MGRHRLEDLTVAVDRARHVGQVLFTNLTQAELEIDDRRGVGRVDEVELTRDGRLELTPLRRRGVDAVEGLPGEQLVFAAGAVEDRLIGAPPPAPDL